MRKNGGEGNERSDRAREKEKERNTYKERERKERDREYFKFVEETLLTQHSHVWESPITLDIAIL